jgi:hypothetical protein
MNSTWIKIAIAYTAGMITYAVYQNHEESERLEEFISLSIDTTEIDSASFVSCACDNDPRYDVRPKEESGNYPIDDFLTCQSMINGTTETTTSGKDLTEKKGAWFSKIALDLIFCHAPDANGIFVYKGTMPDDTKEEVFIVEAARTNKITTADDGSSTVYYSRTLCPTICGRCGD